MHIYLRVLLVKHVISFSLYTNFKIACQTKTKNVSENEMNGKYCTLHHQIGKAANKRHMDDGFQQGN